MGKRKLLRRSFYQCDWTGLPMQSSNCYMPTWVKGKASRRGSYCNWESVLAHAADLHGSASEAYACVSKHVEALAGPIGTAPPVDTLVHFGGTQTAEQYHEACCRARNSLPAVKLLANGTATEVELKVFDGVPQLAEHLDMAEHTTWHSAAVVQKCRKNAPTAFYNPEATCTNVAATRVCKTPIVGDALLLRCTAETCYMPRECFLPYTLSMHSASCNNKRHNPVALTPAEYQQLKQGLQSSLSTCEQAFSAGAVRPRDLALALPMPLPTGKELVEAARQMGHSKPGKWEKLAARIVLR